MIDRAWEKPVRGEGPNRMLIGLQRVHKTPGGKVVLTAGFWLICGGLWLGAIYLLTHVLTWLFRLSM